MSYDLEQLISLLVFQMCKNLISLGKLLILVPLEVPEDVHVCVYQPLVVLKCNCLNPNNLKGMLHIYILMRQLDPPPCSFSIN